MDSNRRLVVCALLLLSALAVPYCTAQEPVVVRLGDAVGDTIDVAERDSFGLFPNTAGFQEAVILALSGPEFYAEIKRARADSTVRIFLRIMPTDLERIRFLIDNRGDVAARQRSDSSYARALASFWHTIEDQPLRNMAGEPAIEEEVAPPLTETEPPTEPAIAEEIPQAYVEEATAGKPPEAKSAGGPQPQRASIENRYNYTLHGVTCGSAIGGCIGSWTGLTYVRTEHPECSPSYSVYRVDPCVFGGAAIGATALGTGAGYALGNNLDRKAISLTPPPKEGKGWRTGCTIGAVIPGLVLGTAFFTLAGSSYYGKTEPFEVFGGRVIENDPDGLTLLPMALTGVCIAVEVTTIGYRIGRAIDRRNAEKAETKRRTLDR